VNAERVAPDYGNWVSTRILYALAAVAIFCLAISVVFLAAIAASAAFAVAFAYFAFARYAFSPRGRNVQAQVRGLVLWHLEWDGHGDALDIGCGNAPLTIGVAKKYPDAHVTGIDYWGERWGYSQRMCEHNAAIEGVADRVTFQRASASALPFDADSFDAAVSNLVFHEVGDAPDKRAVLKEAFRVVKKGGAFAFQDLFLLKRVYGDVDELLAEIRSWGVARVEFVDTSKAGFPRALRLPFMLGAIGIIYGAK